MILQPCTVELTKIHYYDKNKIDRNLAVCTISQETAENNFNKNVIIKKNIFGHRWVLKLNENEEVQKKSKSRIVVYVLVFCSIVIAVCFGIFFSVEKKLFHSHNDTVPYGNISKNVTHKEITLPVVPQNADKYQIDRQITTEKSQVETFNKSEPFCSNCNPPKEVCLKVNETEKPQCIKTKNDKDPTGCGGLCQINIHFCQLLDSKSKVYQCSMLRNILKCPNNTFNCGNMCITSKKQCDGRMDCINGSDEKNCDCNLETHFQCGNFTSCLEKHRKCDHRVDCWDKSDESSCSSISNCLQDEITCFNGQCISRDNYCDGKFDCEDRTDEPEGCQI